MFEQNNYAVNITVENLILAPVSGYAEQFLRPYDIKVTHDDLIKLENLVGNALNRSVSSIKATELANTVNVLEPMAAPIAKSNIIGGWGQERAVFMMTASWVDNITRAEEVLYLTGYSDYPELNPTTGTVSEKMMLYPNTAILLVKINTANGPMLKIKNSFTIEYEQDANNFNVVEDMSFNDETLLLRPYDTLSVINNITEGYNTIPVEATLKNVNTIDREDLIPTNHLTTVVNSLIQGSFMNDGLYTSDTLTFSKASSRKTRIEDIQFFRKEFSDQGTNPGLSFQLGWLFKLDPTFNSERIAVANYLGNGQVLDSTNVLNANIPLILTSNIGENAEDATLESNMAVLVRDSVSSLIAKNMLIDISFTITNNTPTAEYIFQPYVAYPAVNGINLSGLVEKFKLEFMNLVAPQLSKNNNLLIDIDVYSSMTGDTKVAVSVNGMEKRLYRFPTFADSLYNSMLTNKDMFMKVSQDYKSIVDQTLAAASMSTDDLTAAPLNEKYTY